MQNKRAEKTLATYFLVGAPFVTLFLLTSNVSDPVNVTKLFALGGLAGAVGVVTFLQQSHTLWVNSRVFVLTSGLLIVFSIISIVTSVGPLSQNLYGVYGRNTGFLTYFFLILIALASASLRNRKSFEFLLYGLFVAGIVNVIYCGSVLLFGDFIGWNNPYGNILGTFGNPNFIGSFLGICIVASIAWALGPNRGIKTKVTVFLLSAIAGYEILESNAIQGRVVALGGIAVVVFFYLRARTKGFAVQALFSLAMSAVGTVTVLGALQIGPLSSYIYKTSISLRGEYWAAAFRTGENHPLSGVGMDVYGDWYRRMRDEQAMITPGPDTVTNAAHNVVLDFFASGGWPLLLSYLAMITLGAISIIRIARRRREFDATFVAIASAWICYEVQSIISINQIGLAIWGWLFTGALVGFEVMTRKTHVEGEANLEKNSAKSSGNKDRSSNSVISSGLLAGLGLSIGLILAAPPLSSDIRWTSALRSQDLEVVEKALAPTYLQPQSSLRYAQIVQSLEQSKLYEKAHEYALKSVEFNPDYFEAWKSLYYATNATPQQKSEALENLKRLDPLNKDVTK